MSFLVGSYQNSVFSVDTKKLLVVVIFLCVMLIGTIKKVSLICGDKIGFSKCLSFKADRKIEEYNL